MNEVNCDVIFEFLSKVDKDFEPALSSNLNLKEYSKKIASKASLFTNFKNGNLLGLCAVYATDNVNYQAYLTMLAVDPCYRGLGIAKRLIVEMEEKLSFKGFESVKLEVYKTNQSAYLLYSNHGYKIVEEVDTSYFMQKDLARC